MNHQTHMLDLKKENNVNAGGNKKGPDPPLGGRSGPFLLLQRSGTTLGLLTGMGRQKIKVTNERDSLRGVSHAWLG